MNEMNQGFELIVPSDGFPEIDYGFVGLGRPAFLALPVETPLERVDLGLLEPLGLLQKATLFDNGPRNYVRPDAFVLDDLAKALAEEPLIKSWNLEIECEKGYVRIKGRVDTRAARKRLELLLASIHGINDVDITAVDVSKGVEAVTPGTEQQTGEE